MPKKTKAPKLTILDGIDLPCPLSGFQIDGKIFATHFMAVRLCRGGTNVFAVCNPHSVRSFINQPLLVKRCQDAAKLQSEGDDHAAQDAG